MPIWDTRYVYDWVKEFYAGISVSDCPEIYILNK